MSNLSAFCVVALGTTLLSGDMSLKADGLKLTIFNGARTETGHRTQGAEYSAADVRYKGTDIERGYVLKKPERQRSALSKFGDFSKGVVGAVGDGIRAVSAPVVGVVQRVRSHEPERPQSAPETYAHHTMDYYVEAEKRNQAQLEMAQREQARQKQAQLEQSQRRERQRIEQEAENVRLNRLEKEQREHEDRRYAARNEERRHTAAQNGILSGRHYSADEIASMTPKVRAILSDPRIKGRVTDKYSSPRARTRPGQSEYELWRGAPTSMPSRSVIEPVRIWD
jgi:hypothetical protein